MFRFSPRTMFVLVLFWGLSAFATANPYIPSPEPGAYNRDIFFSLAGGEGQVAYRIDIGTHHGNAGEWESFSNPVRLTALQGEERQYTIELKDGTQYRYLIDKKIPLSPIIAIEENTFFSLSGHDPEDSLFFRVVSTDHTEHVPFQRWSGKKEKIPFSDETLVAVEAYAVDQAGNTGILAASYVQKPRKGAESLSIINPVPGVFRNAQLFYVDTDGFEWVRYTIDDEDPVLRGAPYTKPLLIRSRGLVKLKVAALPLGSTTPLRSEVTFAQYPTGSFQLPPSGLYSKALSIELPEQIEVYALSNAGEINQQNGGAISLKGTPGARSVYPLRFTIDGEELEDPLPGYESEYRYLYIMDYRRPGAPGIELDKGLPFSGNLTVTLTSSQDESIYYTLNGATPDRFALPYRGSFTIDSNDWAQQGSIELRAVAYGKNGIPSEERRLLLPFDALPPDKPIVSVSEESEGSYAFDISVSDQEAVTILYEIAFDGAAPYPGVDSPRGESHMVLSLPKGSHEQASLRFAAMDAAGNISFAAEPVELSYDSIPPGRVELELRDSTVVCTSSGDDETIEYQLTDGQSQDEKPVWLRYEGAVQLPIKEGQLNRFSFKARSVDAAGNIGPVADISPIFVDSRKVFSYDLKGIPEGQTSSDRCIITIETDEAVSCRYRLLLLGELGEEAVVQEAAYQAPLIVDGEDGADILYRLEVTPFSSITQVDGSTTNYYFRIDRRPPPLPSPEVLPEILYVRGPTQIKLTGIENDSQVWYMLDGFESKTPVDYETMIHRGSVALSDGTIMLDFPGDGAYRLEGMSIDAYGNYTIGSLLDHIVCDSLPPEVPKISYTEVRDGWAITADIGDGELLVPSNDSTDGSFFLPYQSSVSTFPEPLRLASVDEAGNRSDEIMLQVLGKTLFIDGRPVASEDAHGDARNVPQFVGTEEVVLPKVESLVRGIPHRFWSGEAVTIRPDFDGIIRYELGVGGEAPLVSSRSDRLTEPITLQAEAGQSFLVSLRVALFLDLGGKEQLVHSEQYQFGIDRNPPVPPIISGVGEDEYYRDDRKVEIRSAGEEVAELRYRLMRVGDGEEGEFQSYDDPITVASDQGVCSDFVLEAYAVDEAGNMSTKERVAFSIDKAVLYVSQGGDDGGDGSRAAPYRSLIKAVRDAASNGMTTILLSAGRFPIDSTIRLDRGTLTIQGEALTVISTNTPFDSASMFAVNGGNLTLRNLSIDTLAAQGAILKQMGGLVRMEKVKLYQASGPADATLLVKNASLFFDHSELHFGPLSDASLISVEHGELALVASRLTGSAQSVDATLIKSTNSRVTIDDSSIRPGESTRLTSVGAEKSDLTIIDSELYTGDRDDRASACRLYGGSLYLLNSSLISGRNGRLPILIDADSCDLVLERSLLQSRGREGSVQLRQKNGTLKASHTVFTCGEATGGFFYGIQSSESQVHLEDFIFYAPTAGDTIALDTRGRNDISIDTSSFTLPSETSGGPVAMVVRTSPDGSGSISVANSLFFGPIHFPNLPSDGKNRFFDQIPSRTAGNEDLSRFLGVESHPAQSNKVLYEQLMKVDPVGFR
ncbi:FN3 associated domain-containing protein [Sediminispirochaeta smaragdinae]|uniref:GH29D-like beta-sandwich domain-containing protein n=1 Tax=Sediminispirochaeta smaragdinae (strain DSM 11293 / JCM 15392 / SEBR 4228) TaxID=573413 RepID=E1R3B7_SEDSS|nr:FN3 associated domain-containing protein [Sediminispirochaeta smaragdinae]ADK81548.1 hypothetical protein Spirs_2434 [Sediminispirochaeta smaragdinae DSM 11293]